MASSDAITRHVSPCFQSHDPTCTDKILANRKTMFKTSKTFESGLSDHHKIVPANMKSRALGTLQRKTLILNVLILP